MAFFSSGSDDEGPAGGAYRVDVDRGDSGLTRIRDVFLSKPASASLVVWVCLRWCHAVRTSGQFLWSLPPLLPHYVVPLAVSSERKGGWGCMRFAVCSSAQVVACKALLLRWCLQALAARAVACLCTWCNDLRAHLISDVG